MRPRQRKTRMILASQIRASRALLGLSQGKLSELAGVGIATIKRIEIATEISGAARTLWKIQTALEEAGIEFIPADDSKGPGVRLKGVGKRAVRGDRGRK